MEKIWSVYLQNDELLYKTRSLRFCDKFQNEYMKAFNISTKMQTPAIKMLEIGCGPGALSESLSRWYPYAEITGCDRDINFIRIAAERNNRVNLRFTAGDAISLPFDENFYDVTISHTVSEHVEPKKFYSEQYRVLKQRGVSLTLNPSRWVKHYSECVTEMSDFENDLWKRTEKYFSEVNQKYNVGKYGLNEMERLREIEKHGFRDISAHYISIDLTPDNADMDENTAVQIIEAGRITALDPINYLDDIAPGVITNDEKAEWISLINQKYDKRISLYKTGERQWDTDVTLLTVIRAVK